MKRLRRFITHDGGVSAVEFALFSPLLILVVAAIVTGWRYSTQMMEMRTAVKSGANYVLQGGSDLDSAKSAVLMSWASKPDDGAVQVVRECYCAAVVSACSTVCTGSGAIPNISVIITATGSVDMPLYNMFATAKVQAVREERIRVR